MTTCMDTNYGLYLSECFPHTNYKNMFIKIREHANAYRKNMYFNPILGVYAKNVDARIALFTRSVKNMKKKTWYNETFISLCDVFETTSQKELWFTQCNIIRQFFKLSGFCTIMVSV